MGLRKRTINRKVHGFLPLNVTKLTFSEEILCDRVHRLSFEDALTERAQGPLLRESAVKSVVVRGAGPAFVFPGGTHETSTTHNQPFGFLFNGCSKFCSGCTHRDHRPYGPPCLNRSRK